MKLEEGLKVKIMIIIIIFLFIILELDIPRFKILVSVIVTEQRGQGMKQGCRALWDEENDSMATYNFGNVKEEDSGFGFFDRIHYFVLLRLTVFIIINKTQKRKQD
jgi:hypothetical protein